MYGWCVNLHHIALGVQSSGDCNFCKQVLFLYCKWPRHSQSKN